MKKPGDASSASSRSNPSLFAPLFQGKSNDDEDEGASAPAVSEKTAPAGLMASAVPAKSADPVPRPRARPAPAATFQLASADAQIVQSAKTRQAASAAAQKAEPKPQTPADIINARGFWGDAPATPKQATPAQVAAITAREALATADPQSTASISAAFQALAYAPAASSPVDRSNIVAASAPIPRSGPPSSVPRNPLDAPPRVGRYRNAPDARAFRKAASRDRHEFLGRPADGNGLRPVHGIGDRCPGDTIVRAADRIAALSASSNAQRLPQFQRRPREREDP